MTIMTSTIKYTSDRCNNMLPEEAKLRIGCHYESFVNHQEQDVQLFIVGVFTLENIITMMGFATVLYLISFLFKKDHDDEAKLAQINPTHGYCSHCGFINEHKATLCAKCGSLLRHALDHEPPDIQKEDLSIDSVS